MKDELKSIKQNGVWDLVKLLEGCKGVGCKYVFKTNVTLITILNIIRFNLLSKSLLKKITLIIRKHLHLFIKKIL